MLLELGRRTEQKAKAKENVASKMPSINTTMFSRSCSLVKVKLVQVKPKQLPSSCGVYMTEDTDTEMDPHPNTASQYFFEPFDSDMLSRPFSSVRPSEVEEYPRPDHRVSLFQPSNRRDMSADLPHFDGLSSIKEQPRSASKGSYLKPKLSRQGSRGGPDQKPRLSSFNVSNNTNQNDSNYRNLSQMIAQNLAATIGGMSVDTNLANSSKLLTDTMNNKSILKTSNSHQSRDDRGQLKVRFSKLRTVVYFNMLHTAVRRNSRDLAQQNLNSCGSLDKNSDKFTGGEGGPGFRPDHPKSALAPSIKSSSRK